MYFICECEGRRSEQAQQQQQLQRAPIRQGVERVSGARTRDSLPPTIRSRLRTIACPGFRVKVSRPRRSQYACVQRAQTMISLLNQDIFARVRVQIL